MTRILSIFLCQIALVTFHLPAATAADQRETTVDNEQVRYVQVVKRCQQVENPILVLGSALYGLDPVGWVRAELGQKWPRTPKLKANIELTPKHGTIDEDYMVSGKAEDLPFYVYRPNNNFRGRDHAQISVSIDGRTYLVDFSIQVVEVTVDGKCSK